MPELSVPSPTGLESPDLHFLTTFLVPRKPEDLPLMSSDEWRRLLGQDPQEVTQRFVEEDLLTSASLSFHLDAKFSVAELRNLAGRYGDLPKRGGKDQLILHLIQADYNGMWEAVSDLMLLQCSERGEKLTKEYLGALSEDEPEAATQRVGLPAEKLREYIKWVIAAGIGGVIGNRLDALVVKMAKGLLTRPKAALVTEPETSPEPSPIPMATRQPEERSPIRTTGTPRVSSLRYTKSGLVIDTPDNINRLLSLPSPPKRIWLEKTEMEMCLVPAGEFLMGSAEDDKDAYSTRRPQHWLYLDAYYIGRYPVTQAQYARFVRETGHRVPYSDEEWCRPYNWNRARQVPPAGKENHPVVLVNWYDALAYCRWAGLRLPSEAEWEKSASWDAAKGRKRCYPWGDRWDAERCNSKESGIGRTTPVGKYSPEGDSPYGCADMAGNVWEWTSSLFNPYPYDATDGREDLDAESCRVVRSGSWDFSQLDACCWRRIMLPPLWKWDVNGFRVCVSSISPPLASGTRRSAL